MSWQHPRTTVFRMSWKKYEGSAFAENVNMAKWSWGEVVRVSAILFWIKPLYATKIADRGAWGHTDSHKDRPMAFSAAFAICISSALMWAIGDRNLGDDLFARFVRSILFEFIRLRFRNARFAVYDYFGGVTWIDWCTWSHGITEGFTRYLWKINVRVSAAEYFTTDKNKCVYLVNFDCNGKQPTATWLVSKHYNITCVYIFFNVKINWHTNNVWTSYARIKCIKNVLCLQYVRLLSSRIYSIRHVFRIN